MSKPDPSKVRFSGPLSVYAAGWRENLMSCGYAPSSATIKLQLFAHLSRWLNSRHLTEHDLTAAVVDGFLSDRRVEHSQQVSLKGLEPALQYLRLVGASPLFSRPQVALTAEETLLADYRRYLASNRGLSAPVIDAYSHWIAPFLRYLSENGCRVDRGDLTADAVVSFLVGRLGNLSPKSAKMTTTVLRSFLSFAHVSGKTPVLLAAVVPPVVSWRLAGLPRVLTGEQVAAMLAVPDRARPVGRRDYAVVLVFLRLGLRSAELAALQLEDMHWDTGTMVVRGKGGRTDTMPLPVDVGHALIEYLRYGRPADTAARELFITMRAPFRGLSRTGASCVVGRLAKNADLGVVHAHRLRHTAASNVLNAGASLEEVAQFLRHNSTDSSAIYAKTDMARLAILARPWPATAGAS